MNPTTTDQVFSALSDPNRRLIVESLAADGAATATTLSAKLGVTRQGAAKHLAALVEAGIVAPSREGREVKYELVRRGLEPGSLWLERVGAEWDGRFDSLKRRVDG